MDLLEEAYENGTDFSCSFWIQSFAQAKEVDLDPSNMVAPRTVRRQG